MAVDIVKGPSGERYLSAADIDSMPVATQAQLVIALQETINANPNMDIVITDTSSGGLLVRWRTK